MKHIVGFCILASILVVLSAFALAAPLPIATPSSHGYRVAVEKVDWGYDEPGRAYLCVSFQVQNQDGTPAAFGRATPFARVYAWSAENMDGEEYHGATVSYLGGSHFLAAIRDFDPRNRIAHVEYDIEDPKATDPGSSTTNLTFPNVPLPTTMDAEQPANISESTPFGSIVTIKGVTFATHGVPHTQAPPATLFDITVDQAANPGESMSIRSVAAYDGATQLRHRWSVNDLRQVEGGVCNPDYDQIAPGDFRTLNFEFEVFEHRKRVGPEPFWLPFETDIPLSLIKTTQVFGTGGPGVFPPTIGHSSVNIHGDHLDMYIFKKPYDTYRIETQFIASSASPSEAWYMQDVYWAGPGAPKPNPRENSQQLDWDNEMYWNIDGTPIKPNQSYAYVGTFNKFASWPLVVTFARYKREISVLTFTEVPVPISGQDLTVNIAPDSPTDSGIKLTELIGAGAAPSSSLPILDYMRRAYGGPSTMNAVITGTGSGVNNVGVATLSAVDGQGYALDWISRLEPTRQWAAANRDAPQTIVRALRTPPLGAKSFNLKLLYFKEIPVGDPVTFSIDKAGTWTVIQPTPTTPDSQQ